jgi:hypothetical protein
MILLPAATHVAWGVGNNNCAGAEPIGDVTDMDFDTRDASFDGPGLCLTSPNIWYCYTASCTGNVTVSLLGSGYDTMLAVYDGCKCDPTSDDLIECNDDFGAGYQSEITFAAIGGKKYLIEIGGYSSETGRGILNISCEGEPLPEPSKDDCANAEAIGDVKDLPFDTTEATTDGPGLCLTSPNIWYCYTATCTGNATVSTAGSAFDTMLAVYKGCECDPTSDNLIKCDDDSGPGTTSEITFPTIAGGQYLIEVGGYSSETGQGVLNVSCQGEAIPSIPGKPDLGYASDSTNSMPNRGIGAYLYPTVRGYFPTVYDDGSGLGPYGPAHLNVSMVAYLGESITAESEADRGPDEDYLGTNNLVPATYSPDHDGGDDSIDLPLSLPNCGLTSFDYEVTVVDPNTDLWVNVWFDFNRDGDWDDTLDCPGGPVPEWAVQNQFLFDLPVGFHEITTPGFKSVLEGVHDRIWMRITLSEQPWTGGSAPGERGNGGSGPQGKYLIGETEDYQFVPEVPVGPDCPLCEDVNGDGVIDMDDLADYTAKWLENCI